MLTMASPRVPKWLLNSLRGRPTVRPTAQSRGSEGSTGRGSGGLGNRGAELSWPPVRENGHLGMGTGTAAPPSGSLFLWSLGCPPSSRGCSLILPVMPPPKNCLSAHLGKSERGVSPAHSTAFVKRLRPAPGEQTLLSSRNKINPGIEK